MTTRQLILCVAFLALGAIILVCNRFLTGEGLRWWPVAIASAKLPPVVARIFVIAWGLASLILGTLLLTGTLK